MDGAGQYCKYQVLRDTDASPSGRQRIATLSRATRSYSDHTVANGRTYRYWIKYTVTKSKVGNSKAGSSQAGSAGPLGGTFGFGRLVTGGAGGC